jgi:hypothetical protein
MASNLNRVWFRVSDDDWARLKKKALKQNLSLNNYLRVSAGLPALQHGGPREYKVDTRRQRAREALAELERKREELLEVLKPAKGEKKKKDMLDAA